MREQALFCSQVPRAIRTTYDTTTTFYTIIEKMPRTFINPPRARITTKLDHARQEAERRRDMFDGMRRRLQEEIERIEEEMADIEWELWRLSFFEDDKQYLSAE
jgi:hypothetical protein